MEDLDDLDDFEEYEAKCVVIRAENETLLAGFGDWLVAKGLTDATINKHLSNISFYINYFLLYYDAISAAEGIDEVSSFLGDLFIRKAMWSSETSIR